MKPTGMAVARSFNSEDERKVEPILRFLDSFHTGVVRQIVAPALKGFLST
jgi:hypothetical protein